MKDFVKRRKGLFIVLGVILIVIAWIFIYPLYKTVVCAIMDPHYEKGTYIYYDIAIEHMQTSEKLKEKYGEDFVFYFNGMEYEMDHTKNEGEAEVNFWVKGHGPYAVYLEWHDGEWIIVDTPKKWRH